ncbi:MAG: OmpA family protein, partial [Planctomycetota bacterium]|nr:OmpA family protein [Planctomycetota bacterium]
AKEEKYASQKDEYQIQLAPKTVGEIRAESPEILTNTVVIHFFPNDWDLHKKVARQVNGKSFEELYDPNADNVLEGVAKLVGQFGAGRVIIEGHTDSSLRGQVPAEAVKELALNRANSVKQALVEKYSLAPERLLVDGLGWDRPADADNAFDHAKNRRVEIKVYPAEKE